MTNLELNYEPQLINFKIPKHTKYHLDRLVKFKGVSRTSVLINLIETWIQREHVLLQEESKVYELMSGLEDTIERSVLRVGPTKAETPVTSELPPRRDWEVSYYDDPPSPIFPSDDDHHGWR